MHTQLEPMSSMAHLKAETAGRADGDSLDRPSINLEAPLVERGDERKDFGLLPWDENFNCLTFTRVELSRRGQQRQGDKQGLRYE